MVEQVEKFDVVDVIRTKRDGGKLSPEEIEWVIDAYTRGAVGDEQMAALAMAIFIRGMERDEISRWTAAMIASGERMNFSMLQQPTADKHSTGGVGDKITLPLAPLVASYGVSVPQLSGRGLGHTGGTLDKLESIPGWQAAISNERMIEILEDPGCVICAAGSGLAPADKKLYALRDITSTVDCVPLIASSIMSKKIAEGTDTLVLDVKVGHGAFMKKMEDAQKLARTMVGLGSDAGVNCTALLTNMNTPLGLTAGNALEVRESVEVLAGGGPGDIVELTCALAAEMLAGAGITGVDTSENLKNGKAMDYWKRMIRAQGGDPEAPLPMADHTETVYAEEDGLITFMDSLKVGVSAWRLGAGRARKEDPVQAEAGIEIHAKPGQSIKAGQPLYTLHTQTPERFSRSLEVLENSVKIVAEDSAEARDYQPEPLIYQRITAADLD